MSSASTVQEYLNSLTDDQKTTIGTIRTLILENLPQGFHEGMQYGMIGYCVPLSVYPNTYNGKPLCYLALATQKNYFSLYLMNIYATAENRRWFETEFQKSGKKMDMGKSCLRFKKVEDLPLELIGQAIARTSMTEFIKLEQAAHPNHSTSSK